MVLFQAVFEDAFCLADIGGVAASCFALQLVDNEGTHRDAFDAVFVWKELANLVGGLERDVEVNLRVEFVDVRFQPLRESLGLVTDVWENDVSCWSWRGRCLLGLLGLLLFLLWRVGRARVLLVDELFDDLLDDFFGILVFCKNHSQFVNLSFSVVCV